MFNARRKNCRTLDQTGKEEYGFDFCSEKIVYKDLCCSRLTFKERRKRKTLPVFRSYKAKEEKCVVESLMLDKAIDKAYRLLISGYRKLDTNRVFLSAYENALAAYKGEYKEDELYIELFKEKSYMYCDELKEIIDVYLPTSELVDELRNQINEWLPGISIEKINGFIEKLFTELFFTNEYKDKILEYRKNDKIDQIYNMVLDLKRFISGQDKIEPMFQNNMFQYYLNKWSANLFLHREGKNIIRLEDLYPSLMEKGNGIDLYAIL